MPIQVNSNNGNPIFSPGVFTGGGGVRCMTQWYKMGRDQKIY